jgi:hypothetical protein
MYVVTSLKPLKIFYDKIVDQKHVVMPICTIFWPNSNIIVIIMLYFLHKHLNVPYNSNCISNQSPKHGLEWNIES